MQDKTCHVIGVVDNTNRNHVHTYVLILKNWSNDAELIYIYDTTEL